jgi:acetyl-CoA synthetase (ADP-forming)
MKEVNRILESAKKNNHDQLSEYESKQVLAAHGIPVVQEILAKDFEEITSAASKIGYPVVLKACSPGLAHKTETGLIEINLRDESDLKDAFERMKTQAQKLDAMYLVQEMVKGDRELVIGMTRDPQFGPCVMFGLGGIYTEALRDVVFRSAPLSQKDASDMMQEIKGNKILGAFRSMAPVDVDTLGNCLVSLGQIGLDHEIIREIDVNPLIIKDGLPVAVDALVVLGAA